MTVGRKCDEKRTAKGIKDLGVYSFDCRGFGLDSISYRNGHISEFGRTFAVHIYFDGDVSIQSRRCNYTRKKAWKLNGQSDKEKEIS